MCCIPRLLPLIPPAPFSHTGRRGSLGVLMPETDDGTQGLPRAQGLQPARAPARQPRRGFPVLREGFSPHEQRRARAGGLCLGEPEENTDWHGYDGCARMTCCLEEPAQAGFVLHSRGLQPGGTRRIPDVFLNLY